MERARPPRRMPESPKNWRRVRRSWFSRRGFMALGISCG
jgi:hypothetical protein